MKKLLKAIKKVGERIGVWLANRLVEPRAEKIKTPAQLCAHLEKIEDEVQAGQTGLAAFHLHIAWAAVENSNDYEMEMALGQWGAENSQLLDSIPGYPRS